jgi:hypothetical protein
MIAYHANVQMHEAKWTDKEGSTVTFKLPMGQQEDHRNPFYYYTKRRKGRAGTRFMMVVVDQKLRQEIYKDEAMLCGWNDSQTNGHTVKFWLTHDHMGHPFEGYERHEPERFYISMVEIDDDQEPIDQQVREKVEKSAKRPSERLSYAAVMLCKNEGFWTWLTETTNVAVNSEDDARIVMLDMLGLPSRGILDKNEYQAKRFHEIVRKPFVEWQEQMA